MSYDEAENKAFNKRLWQIISVASTALGIVIMLSMWGCPNYNVYQSRLAGEAELAQSQYNSKVKINEALATQEAAKALAQAEVERAKGVAQANAIIGESLHNNEDYLRYLWIHNLAEAEKNGAQIIYIPTETNLPILEASRNHKEQAK